MIENTNVNESVENLEAQEVQEETKQVFEDKLVITKYDNEFKIERLDEEGNSVQINPVFDTSVEDLLKGAVDIINKKRFEQLVQSHNQLYGELSVLYNMLMGQANPEMENVEPTVEIPE